MRTSQQFLRPVPERSGGPDDRSYGAGLALVWRWSMEPVLVMKDEETRASGEVPCVW